MQIMGTQCADFCPGEIAYVYSSLVNATTAVILIGAHCSCTYTLSLFCEVLNHIALKELVSCLSRYGIVTSGLFGKP